MNNKEKAQEAKIKMLFNRFHFYVKRIHRRLEAKYVENIDKNHNELSSLGLEQLENCSTDELLIKLEQIVSRMENFYHNTKKLDSKSLTILHYCMVAGAEQSAGIRLVDQDCDTKIQLNPDLFEKKL